MNEIRIREMRPDEVGLFVKWLYLHKDVNQVDPSVFRRNQAKIFVAEDDTGILNFIPVKAVYEYGALAPRPGLAAARQARVVQAMQKFMVNECRKYNVPDIYLMPNDKRFAKCLEKLGWKEVPGKTMRLNVNKILPAPSKIDEVNSDVEITGPLN